MVSDAVTIHVHLFYLQILEKKFQGRLRLHLSDLKRAKIADWINGDACVVSRYVVATAAH